MNKKEFLNKLDNFQEKMINRLLKLKSDKIIVKGNKFIGKTILSIKLFNFIKDVPVIYHSGYNPKYGEKAYTDFINDLKKLTQKYSIIYIILDEFYNKSLLNYLTLIKNVKIYIFTNDTNLRIKGFKSFNYLKHYNRFIIINLKKYDKIDYTMFNLHQILYLFDNSDRNLKEFDRKVEKLRKQSILTSTKIKINNTIKEKNLIFEKNL